MGRFFLAILMALIFAVPVYAKPLTLVTERGQILIPSIPDWEMGEKMFGMPYLYFSPQKNGQRSNISFTATGVETEMDLNSLGRNPKTYKAIKEKWAKSINGKALSFDGYKVFKNNQGHDVHQIGFEFLHENKQYLETSYYIDCRGRLIYAKSLRLLENVAHQKDFENLIREMDCGL